MRPGAAVRNSYLPSHESGGVNTEDQTLADFKLQLVSQLTAAGLETDWLKVTPGWETWRDYGFILIITSRMLWRRKGFKWTRKLAACTILRRGQFIYRRMLRSAKPCMRLCIRSLRWGASGRFFRIIWGTSFMKV